MSFSHENKWIWVGIPKTGTTSLDAILKPRCKYEGYKHDTIMQIKKQLNDKEKFEEYYKFSFVRNPYDKAVSFYWHMKKKRDEIYKGSFKDWITSYYKFSEKKDKPAIGMEQIDCLSDENGLAMDFIGRFENITPDFRKICKVIGVANRPVPRHNFTRKVGDGYKKYYCKVTKDIVSKWYARDIEEFKYEF